MSLQRVPSSSKGCSAVVRAPHVPAVDRTRRGPGPRHRLVASSLRPRRLMSFISAVPSPSAQRCFSPCCSSLRRVRSTRERRGGSSLDGELEPVPGGGRDGAQGGTLRPMPDLDASTWLTAGSKEERKRRRLCCDGLRSGSVPDAEIEGGKRRPTTPSTEEEDR
ncbi:uncharacterized protein A4U43_C08F12500 [Asparagus officinalis]|nr:uncharacterized protein A4U43_C08F12500 [Asparagus officinalis]